MGNTKKKAYEIVKGLFAAYIETETEEALHKYIGACEVYEPIFGEFILERKDRVEILGSATREECEEFIKQILDVPGDGIECGLFFKMAEEQGYYKAESYGTEMSKALRNLTVHETRCTEDGTFAYNVFVRKEEA